MTVRFHLVLRQQNKQPAGNIAVAVHFTDVRSGKEERKLQGRTDNKGAVTLSDASLSNLRYLPQFRVTWRKGRRDVTLDDPSFEFSDGTVNLGTHTIDTGAPSRARMRTVVQPIGPLRVKPQVATRVDTTKKVNFKQYDQLRKTRDSLQLDVSKLQEQKQELAVQLEKKDETFQQEKTRLLRDHRSELQRKHRELETVRGQLDELSQAQGADVSIDHLLARTSTSLEKAREEIEQKAEGFTLGNVTMRIRGLSGQGGTGMSFVGREQLEKIDASAFSEMELEFRPPRPRVVAREETVRVPDIGGYTATMATRQLREHGLRVESEYEAVIDAPGQRSDHGRVVHQEPAAHADVPPGTRILIAIGKRMNREE